MANLEDGDSIKSHREIMHIFDEIREFEKEDNSYEINLEKKREEPIEIEHRTLEYSDEFLDEDRRNKFFDKLRKIHFTTHPGKSEHKPINPATFKVGFNENGDFVNLDFKNKKELEESSFKIKDLFKRKKDKEKNTLSFVGKIKSKLTIFAKLKNVIPSRSKNEDEKESGDEE